MCVCMSVDRVRVQDVRVVYVSARSMYMCSIYRLQMQCNFNIKFGLEIECYSNLSETALHSIDSVSNASHGTHAFVCVCFFYLFSRVILLSSIVSGKYNAP